MSSLSQIVALAAAFIPSLGFAAESTDGDWPMAAHDYASTRFSPLTQITTANVADLQVAFTFSTGVNRGQEAAPIVVDDTMYIVTPYPNVVYALDLAQPGAPQNGSTSRSRKVHRKALRVATSSTAVRCMPAAR